MNKKNSEQNVRANPVIVAITLGILLGIVIGVATKSIAIGILVGLVIGFGNALMVAKRVTPTKKK